MKRVLTFLFLLLATFAFAQETPPTGLKAVNAQFYINLADSTIWQNKGTPYGWHKVAKYKELTAGLLTKADKTYVDSLLALKADLSALTAHTGNTSNPHAVTKTQVGLGNADNTSDLNKPISTATQTALDAKVNNSEKGVIGGIATLDGTGKVPLSQINDALIGSVNYKGTYNIASNTPALPAAATANKGWYYIVNDTKTVFNGDSIFSGDWVISNGVAWAGLRQNRPEADPVFLAQKASLVQLNPATPQAGNIDVSGNIKTGSTFTVSGNIIHNAPAYSSGGYSLIVKNTGNNSYQAVPSSTFALSGDLSNYLPKSAGSGSPLSGDLYINKATDAGVFTQRGTGRQFFTGSDNTSWYISDVTAGSIRYIIDASGNNTWTGSGTFGGPIMTTAALGANQTSTGLVDFFGGNLRLWGFGASGVEGGITFRTGVGGTSSTERMSLTSTLLNVTVPLNGTSATFSGSLNTTAGTIYAKGSGTEGSGYQLNAITMGYDAVSSKGWITAGGASARTTLTLNAGAGNVEVTSALSGTSGKFTSSLDFGYVNGSNLFRADYNTTDGATLQSYITGVGGKLSLNPLGGYVGIGTTNPDSKFEVNTGTNAVFRSVFSSSGIVEIGNYNSTNGYRQLDIGASYIRLLTGPAGGTSASVALTIASNQAITVANLAGTGSRVVTADASGTLSASSSSTIASGPFTPTNTNVANISSSSPLAFTYNRVGDVVSFTYALTVTTSGSGSSTLDFTLPVSSNFTNSYDLIATASGAITSPGLTANTTDDKGRLIFTASGAGTYNITVSGHYKIL